MSDVERIYTELAALLEVIGKNGEPSDITAAENIAAKALLLSAASHFERKICDIILEDAGRTGSKPIYINFIRRQALERKYHSMFAWDSPNANRFFSLFGDDIKAALSQKANNDGLNYSISAFLSLGSKRNELVHENFAGFSLDLTFSEVWGKFNEAQAFTVWLRASLAELSDQQDAA